MFGRLIIITGAQFSETEFHALRSLRTTYQDAHYLFTEHELTNLRFQRWLVRSPYWHRSLDQPPPLPITQLSRPMGRSNPGGGADPRHPDA